MTKQAVTRLARSKNEVLRLTSTAIIAVSLYTPTLSPAATADVEQLRQQIEQQQRQLDQMKMQLDAAVESIESGAERQSSAQTSLGGYGELHYSNSDSGDELDFHRFVLFVGHQFSERTRFYSEIELEHAFIEDSDNGGSKGEVELEQAFIEHDFTEALTGRAGVFLMPVGIINETHEPTTFYGIERNPVETNIIPTTWWEGGVNIDYRSDNGWRLDAAVTSGLDVPTTGGNAYLIRKGRTKVSEAPADNLAFTGRVKYTGIRGLELAATVQRQDDITQGIENIGATLFSGHAIYGRGPFELRALFARWDLDGDGPAATGRDEQRGWYVESSYRVLPRLGVFARYNAWDNEAGNSDNTEKKSTRLGFNYWLEDNVVLKADWGQYSGAADGDGFNLGVGYQF